MKDNISIVGVGNLGLSLVKGLVESGEFTPRQFKLSRRRIEKLNEMDKTGYHIFNDNKLAVENTSIVVLAVLPQKINEVLQEIKNKLDPDTLLISLVSGVEINNISSIIGDQIPIVRAMPNTAISIRESMTCITTIQKWEHHLDKVKSIFDHVGETAIINEEKMTSATALCACGIAFFLRSIRAASQGGNEIDFHASEALKMAAQTAKGAASLLLETTHILKTKLIKLHLQKDVLLPGLMKWSIMDLAPLLLKGLRYQPIKQNIYINDGV